VIPLLLAAILAAGLRPLQLRSARSAVRRLDWLDSTGRRWTSGVKPVFQSGMYRLYLNFPTRPDAELPRCEATFLDDEAGDVVKWLSIYLMSGRPLPPTAWTLSAWRRLGGLDMPGCVIVSSRVEPPAPQFVRNLASVFAAFTKVQP
jgi:hypothetical protein